MFKLTHYPHPHLIDNCIYVHYIKQVENFLN